MRIGWTRQPRGAQCCAAQCTCHAPQCNNSNEGAQRRTGEPLTTATFAGTLRGRSAKEREEEEERILLLVWVSVSAAAGKSFVFLLGKTLRQVQAGAELAKDTCPDWERAAAAVGLASSLAAVLFRGACKLAKRKDEQGRRRILLAGCALPDGWEGRGGKGRNCCYFFWFMS